MKESHTPVFLTFSESEDPLPYYKRMNNLGYVFSDLENGENWTNHPGTVISNLVSFPRNNTSLKKLGGKQQIKCWK